MHMHLFIFIGGKEEEKMEKIAVFSTQIIERRILGAARNFLLPHAIEILWNPTKVNRTCTEKRSHLKEQINVKLDF